MKTIHEYKKQLHKEAADFLKADTSGQFGIARDRLIDQLASVLCQLDHANSTISHLTERNLELVDKSNKLQNLISSAYHSAFMHE